MFSQVKLSICQGVLYLVAFVQSVWLPKVQSHGEEELYHYLDDDFDHGPRRSEFSINIKTVQKVFD